MLLVASRLDFCFRLRPLICGTVGEPTTGP